jgi:hypothetical protein
MVDVEARWLTARCSGRRLRAAAERVIVSRTELSFEDSSWKELKAGYRTSIDLRPLLQRFESDRSAKATKHEA